jgi:hypothetical protein
MTLKCQERAPLLFEDALVGSISLMSRAEDDAEQRRASLDFQVFG